MIIIPAAVTQVSTSVLAGKVGFEPAVFAPDRRLESIKFAMGADQREYDDFFTFDDI
jgi:hypothetical protein